MTLVLLLPIAIGGLVLAVDSLSSIGPVLGPAFAVVTTALILRARNVGARNLGAGILDVGRIECLSSCLSGVVSQT